MFEKNIIIFGGTGYIGSSLAQYFLKKKKKTKIFLLDIRKPKINKKNKNIKYIKCDVRKKINIKFKEKIDLIINLAAIHREPGHLSEEYFDTNVEGSKNIVMFANKNKINNIIFTSSISVYGNKILKKNENTKLYPETPYGISKLISEKIFENWQSKNPKKRILTISRPGVVFGKEEKGNMERLKNLAKNPFFLFVGNKNTYKATIYIKELINQILWVNLGQKKKILDSVVIFNSTTYPVLKFIEIFEIIRKIQRTKNFTIEFPFLLILFTSYFIQFFCNLLSIENKYHPTRIKKLKINNFVEPNFLIKNKYNFKYTHLTAFREWID